jgi:nicotinic acid mononucleotide adenylyltransferase
MGYDKIVQIFDPRYYQDREVALAELFQLAEVLVVPRGRGGEQELYELIHCPENEPFARFIHIQPFNAAYRDISSTSVREGWRTQVQAVPQEVRQFMYRTRAYAPPLKRTDGTEVDCYQQRSVRIME